MIPRLSVNVDHVATLRQARLEREPDPVAAALMAELAGADGITVHLREDRRHIQDRDLEVLRGTVKTALNLEMAATDEMLSIALRTRPDLVTLVPENREELTTEGGLDLGSRLEELREFVGTLQEGGVPVNLFIDPDLEAIRQSHRIGARGVEIHTGRYANAEPGEQRNGELSRVAEASATLESSPFLCSPGSAFAYLPVCISTPLAPILWLCLMASRSGSMKRFTGTPPSWSVPTNSLSSSSLEPRSSPPSVVSSSLFSGTRVTRSGLVRSAMESISSVAAISRFRAVLTVPLRTSRSLS